MSLTQQWRLLFKWNFSHFQACILRTCNCGSSLQQCLCVALSSYAKACASLGVVVGDWRKATNCSEFSFEKYNSFCRHPPASLFTVHRNWVMSKLFEISSSLKSLNQIHSADAIFLVNHNVMSQLWHVRRIKNSPTTLKHATIRASPCLALTLAVGWMMRLWRAVAVQMELTWTKETSVPERQIVFVTTTVVQCHRGLLLSTDANGEMISI